MCRLLPTHPKDVGDTKVGNLDVSHGVQEEVLGFDVSMGYTHRMQVGDTIEDLLETAFHFTLTHATSLDGSIEISTRAVLHDFTPMQSLVLNEVDRLNDIDVM